MSTVANLQILLVEQPIVPGGVPRYVADLATSLSQQGVDVTICCPPDSVLVEAIKQKNIRFLPANMVREVNFVADIKALFSIWQILKTNQFDLIHAHSSKAGFLVRLAVKLFRINVPVIYTPHGYAFRPFTGFKRKFFIFLERFFTSDARFLTVAVSEAEKKLAVEEKISTEDKICIVRTGRDYNEYENEVDRSAVLDKLQLPGDSFLLSTVSRLVVEKNLYSFIDSAALVCQQVPNARFVIIGAGPLDQELKQYARDKQVDESVRFLGWRNDVPAILKSSDICLLTSNFEGYPYALLEYLAAHKPIVATDIPAHREIVTHRVNGLLVEVSNAEAIAQAILEIKRNPEVKEMLVEGTRKTNLRTCDEMAQEYRERYCEMIDHLRTGKK